jgi:DNA polymerase delta subunit 1
MVKETCMGCKCVLPPKYADVICEKC